MKKNTPCLVFLAVVLVTVFFTKQVFSNYVEGIDTTDAMGNGLDSTFRIVGVSPYQSIYGQLLHYDFGVCVDFITWCGCGGYFNYSFDDITMSPKGPFVLTGYNDIFKCFVIKSNKDSTYSKVQLLQYLSGKRYVYKYGTNSTPNDRMLIQSDYNRSILYKPNNFWYFNQLGNFGGMQIDTVSWNPPLPNNNHLLGYIFYRSKSGAVIDTNAPVNLAQWDSISFFDATGTDSTLPYHLVNGQNFNSGQYINFVAVYAEGRSNFLSGYAMLDCITTGTIQQPSATHLLPNTIKITTSKGGFSISFQGFLNVPSSISLFSLSGQEVARFPVSGNRAAFLNPIHCNLGVGLYLLRADLPDHSVLTQPFMFTK